MYGASGRQALQEEHPSGEERNSLLQRFLDVVQRSQLLEVVDPWR